MQLKSPLPFYSREIDGTKINICRYISGLHETTQRITSMNYNGAEGLEFGNSSSKLIVQKVGAAPWLLYLRQHDSGFREEIALTRPETIKCSGASFLLSHFALRTSLSSDRISLPHVSHAELQFTAMAQSSSINTQQTNVEAFGRFVTGSFQASPIQSFLVLVSIFILSIAATSWLMLQCLALSPFDQAIPPKQCPSCDRADTMKAKGNDATSRSEE